MPGYSCMYTQFVTATVTITGNMTDFENDVGGIKSRFIQVCSSLPKSYTPQSRSVFICVT